MKKKIKSYIKLQINAGMANPSPPVGPALGQYGVNIIEFCNQFNKKTNNIEKGLKTPVIITVYSDKSFDFIIKTTPTSILLKKFSGIKTGSKKPNIDKVGTISYKKIQEIAKLKSSDMTGYNIKSISKSIIGTAISMGLKVEYDKNDKII